MQRCTLRLSVLWRNPIGSLFLSTYTILHILFQISPCLLCSLLWISRLWHSTEIDSLSVFGFLGHLLRLLIIIRPNTPIFLTGEFFVCFRCLLCRASFLVSSWQLDSAPSTLLSDADASALVPTGQAEKTLQRTKSTISYD